jgi:hypothetical protein
VSTNQQHRHSRRSNTAAAATQQ